VIYEEGQGSGLDLSVTLFGKCENQKVGNVHSTKLFAIFRTGGIGHDLNLHLREK